MISKLSLELVNHYEITVVIYNDIDKVVFPYKGTLIKIKLPYLKNTAENSFYARAIRFFYLIRSLRKIKKERKIDVSISFMEASNFVNILSRRKDKVILSVRSYLSHEMKDIKRIRMFKYLVKLLYNKSDKIVVPAKLATYDLTQNFGVKQDLMKVIYNFIDIDSLNKETASKSLFPFETIDGPVLINIGRLNEVKKQFLFLPVLKKVKETIPSVKLVILGEGPLKQKMIEIAKTLGLSVYDNDVNHSETYPESIKSFDVFLLGFQKDVYPYLKKSDLFVLTSLYEGFPNVMIEAMASGLPVISSDCPSGPREILAPETSITKIADSIEYGSFGVLLPMLQENSDSHDTIDLWAKAIVEMLSQNEKYSLYSGKSKLRSDDFDRKTIIKQWIGLIEE